jgi:hypothetical protein
VESRFVVSDIEDFRARVNNFLDNYPSKKGIVVFWDDDELTITDWANVSGLHAAEFATKYRDMVLKNVDLKDFMYEE